MTDPQSDLFAILIPDSTANGSEAVVAERRGDTFVVIAQDGIGTAEVGSPLPAEAAEAFGNLDRLQAEVTSYDNRGVPFVRVTYPAASVAEPAVQQLTEGQARFLKGRIELGSRIEIPPGPLPGIARASCILNCS